MREAVHTISGGAPSGAPSHLGRCTPSLAVPAPALALLSHVQVGTALGVAVPPDKGWRCPQSNPLLSASQPITATGVAVHRRKGGGAT